MNCQGFLPRNGPAPPRTAPRPAPAGPVTPPPPAPTPGDAAPNDPAVPSRPRGRPSPARRPSTARRPRPAPWARRSGPRASTAIALRQTASSARSIDGSTCRGGGNSPRCTPPEHLADVVALERRLAGQQAVERGAQAVDVASAGPSRSRSPRGLLGAHVGRRAQRLPGSVSADAAGRGWASASARPAPSPARPAQRPWPGPSRPPASRRACRR